ncbi:Protein of unknown function [Lactobacillus helveticus CIRM-BIA 101]|nr:Protein of unknown function [Lactobacillus helveticus CIRM-BIA 101]
MFPETRHFSAGVVHLGYTYIKKALILTTMEQRKLTAKHTTILAMMLMLRLQM